ncbi:MAG: CBS domain-containing protein [Acidimicrobiia bacterium]
MDIVDVMTRDVVSVAPETKVRRAARLMIEGGFSGLPVVDEGRLVGVVSEADLLKREGSRTWMSRVLFGDEATAISEMETVSDVMSCPAETIVELATVQEAARVMTHKGYKRLPVIDKAGKMVGILTRRDVVKAYARPDEDVEGEVVTLLAVLPEPLSHIKATVTDGVVNLTGEVDTSAEARAVCRLVKGIEGVARVENAMIWEVDSEVDANPWAGYALEGKGMTIQSL